MRWRLAVLLALWLGTLSPPLHPPSLPGTAPAARGVRDVEPGQWQPPEGARLRGGRLQPGLVLQPPQVEIEGCNGLPQAHTFQLVNNSGAAGAFDLDYLVPDGHGTLTGPAQLSLGDGQAVAFEVSLTPRLCAMPGETVYGRIDVSGNGWTTAAEIVQAVYLGSRWELAHQLPLACFGWLAETTVDPDDGQEYMYVAGCGTQSTYRYDPRHDTWTTLSATLPQPLYGADGVAYQGRIYARSDGQETEKRRLYIYDVAANAWSSRETPMSIDDRAHYEAVEVGGQIYFLGGERVSGEISSAVERYDPAAGTWVSVAPMLHSRSMAMAWVYADRIYVAGGRNAEGALSSTEVYDPASNTWTEDPTLFASLPAPRFGAGDAILNEQLWLTGGFDTTDSDETLYWTAAGNAWHAGPELAVAASYVESAALAGSLYTVGGLRSTTWLAHNQHLVVCPDRGECQGTLAGQVYDAELPGGPATCTAASLSITPGGSCPVTPGTGDYGPLPLLPGAYLLEASAPGYSLEVADVTLEDGAAATQDIGLWRPRVAASLLPSLVVSAPGASLTIPLQITNTGHLALEYQLLELASTPLADRNELPWLSFSPAAGEIAPLQAENIGVTFECTAAQDGQVLAGRLVVGHSDPCVAPVEIALELACQDRTRYTYLPLLLQAGKPALPAPEGVVRRRGYRRPGDPARTRP